MSVEERSKKPKKMSTKKPHTGQKPKTETVCTNTVIMSDGAMDNGNNPMLSFIKDCYKKKPVSSQSGHSTRRVSDVQREFERIEAERLADAKKRYDKVLGEINDPKDKLNKNRVWLEQRKAEYNVEKRNRQREILRDEYDAILDEINSKDTPEERVIAERERLLKEKWTDKCREAKVEYRPEDAIVDAIRERRKLREVKALSEEEAMVYKKEIPLTQDDIKEMIQAQVESLVQTSDTDQCSSKLDKIRRLVEESKMRVLDGKNGSKKKIFPLDLLLDNVNNLLKKDPDVANADLVLNGDKLTLRIYKEGSKVREEDVAEFFERYDASRLSRILNYGK